MPQEKQPQQRILCCHFTHLPTDRIARHRWGKSWRLNANKNTPDDAPPIVMVDMRKNAMRVVALADDKRLAGICVDQTLNDARAINPDLDCIRHDPAADRQLLEKIARWCERYTPLVSFSGNDGLFLNITGCSHLFGGEDTMLSDLKTRLIAQGFGVSLAICDTAGAAWALAHYGQGKVAAPNAHQDLLEPLPVAALRLSTEQVNKLAKLGLKTVGCIASLPRAPLAARFGDEVLKRLDQALGEADEVLSPIQPVAELVHEKRFFEPIVHEDDIKATIRLLAERLKETLEKRGLGMRQARLQLFRVDGEMVHLQVSASHPVRSPEKVVTLFEERLSGLHEEMDAGFGFDIVRLAVVQSDRMEAQQEDLVAGSQSDEAFSHLIDRLSARLGQRSVQVYQVCDTHIPERRFNLMPAIHAGSQAAAAMTPTEQEHDIATRPVFMFRHPELAEVMAQVPEGPPIRFRWRKAHYEVSRSEGPERIACEWWKDGRSAHTRDYFRVETRDGYRLWLFRHGLYERETDRPRWYVHGMFA